MPQTVRVVTPPTLEPITLAEAKLHLRVDFDTDDDLITALITASRRLCEVKAKIVCNTTTFDVVEDAFPISSGYVARLLRANPFGFAGGMYSTPPGASIPQNIGTIFLPRQPLLGVTSISYVDVQGNTQTLDPSVYTVVAGNPGRIAPAFGQIWPVTYPQIGSVSIRITAGFGPLAADVPANVIAAIKLVLGHLYENRAAVSQDGGFAELPPGLAVGALLGMETQWSYS